jgi:hypothetical protein
VSGDILLVFLNGVKSTAGNSTITTPGSGGWLVAASGGTSNGSVNCTGEILVCPALGASSDSPTISVSSAVWQVETYVIQGGATSTVPWDPTTLPQAGNTSVTSNSNSGVALTTRSNNELVISTLAIRGPSATSAVTWAGGSTVDVAMTGSSNNFISTATQTVATPSTVTPSATWTGGSGTASVLMSIAFAPSGTLTATLHQVNVGGSPVTPTHYVNVSGTATAATRKVNKNGVAV